MEKKIYAVQNKGMTRDYSISVPQNELAFENFNIRIIARDHDTLLSVTNERGNTKLTIDNEETPGEDFIIRGTLLGYCVLNKYITLFTTVADSPDSKDFIYRIKCPSGNTGWTGLLLYNGNLGFSVEHPIEAISYYEREDIQKVYWTDGLNQPRVINITGDRSYFNDGFFNFIRTFESDIKVKINRNENGSGSFPAGVIQYVMTYFTQFGQETNIVYRSPLYYISDSDKGTSADSICTCSFSIDVEAPDKSFNYLKVYSIIRTSLNGPATVNVVGIYNIESDKVSLIDTGAYSETIDPTVLYYIGGREITAGTIATKDNVLFLGDLTLQYDIVDNDLSEKVETLPKTLQFIYNTEMEEEAENYSIPYYPASGYYPYETQLTYPSDRIKTFKGGNKYRIGIQFYTHTGASTQVYWLGDVINDSCYPAMRAMTSTYSRAVLSVNLGPELLDYLNKNCRDKYDSAMLFMAQPSQQDRLVKAQGVLSPTMFNLGNRVSNAPFTVSSWCFRPYGGTKQYQHYASLVPITNYFSYPKGMTVTGGVTSLALPPNIGAEMSHMTAFVNPYIELDQKETNPYVWAKYVIYSTPDAGIFDFRKANKACYGIVGYRYRSDDPNHERGERYTTISDFYKDEEVAMTNLYEQIANWGITSYPSDSDLRDLRSISRNEKNTYTITSKGLQRGLVESDYLESPLSTTVTGQIEKYVSDLGSYFFVDSSVVTMNTPELYDGGIQSVDNLKFRVLGYIELNGVSTSYNIDVEPDSKGTANVLSADFSVPVKLVQEDTLGLTAFPLVETDDVNKSGKTNMWIYPWHKTGSLSEVMKTESQADGKYSVLNTKTIANSYYSYITHYVPPIKNNQGDGEESGGAIEMNCYGKVIGDTKDALYTYEQGTGSYTYQSDYNAIISPSSEIPYYLIDTGIYNSSAPTELLRQNGYLHGGANYSPVDIAYKCSPHILISFTPDSTLGQTILPAVNEDDTADSSSISGSAVLVWDKQETMSYSVSYSVLSDNPDSPLITKTPEKKEPSGDSGEGSVIKWIYTLENVDYQKWKDYIDSPDLSGVYLAQFINTSDIPGINIFEIESISVISEKLEVPVIRNTSFSADNNTLTVYITPSTKVSEYKVTVSYTIEKVVEEETVSENRTKEVTSGSAIVTAVLGVNEGETLVSASVVAQSLGDGTFFTDSDQSQSYPVDLETGTLSEEVPDPLAFEEPSTVDVKITTQLFNTVESTVKCKLDDMIYDKSYIVSNGSVQGYTIDKIQYSQKILGNKTLSVNVPYLMLGEFYRDPDDSIDYGGNTPYARENNTYIPISRKYSLSEILEGKTMYGTEGDTFFQRWDCIKTEPYSSDKENNVVEMLSFMVESYTNLDGRYDVRRGFMDNTATTYENISDINEVYSQSNNFFTGQAISNKFDYNNFPTQITWTSKKIPVADIDAWTNITLSGTLDMDGDKGPVRALRRFNNSLISFQDKGIAEILYNTRTQISTTQGVPIEIANSNQVDGKRYITDKAGCLNKWSIVETSKGIYFIDNINSSISLFNGNVASISDAKGFKNWIGQNTVTDIWNPEDFGNYISFWDRKNDDVYFIGGDSKGQLNVLCYNEMLNQFTSFFDYGNVPMMVNLEDHFIAFKENGDGTGSLWEQETGEYNNIFGEIQDFYTLYRVTPDAFTDKIFSNIEYRADVFEDDSLIADDTFDRIHVWTEYQDTGEIPLEFTAKDNYPDKRQKFRIWRADIPRAGKTESNKYGFDRIRNPWIYLKLIKDGEANKRMEFHNMNVYYYA